MRIVTNHSSVYIDEIEPKPIVMREDSVNVLVQRTQVIGPWGRIVVDQFSDGTLQALAIVDSGVPARRSTATPLEIRHGK